MDNLPENEQGIQALMGTGFDTLRHIENQAAAHDQKQFGQFDDQQQEEQPEVKQPQQSTVIEAVMVCTVVKKVFAPFYPCLEKIYTEQAINEIALAAAPLMEKYGLTSGGVLSKWAPEFAFVVTVGPLALETVRAIREERAAAQAKDVSNDAHASEAA